MAVVCAAYAAQRINSARNGMTSKFGWLQAVATKVVFISITFANPANRSRGFVPYFEFPVDAAGR